MTSPLERLFGDQAGHFAGGVLPDRHVHVEGSTERFPEELRSGVLSSPRRLSEVYKGMLQMAGGAGADLRQITIEASPPLLLAMGLTVYFIEALSSVPSLRPWFGQLAGDLGIPPRSIRCAAWASPAGAGLSPHYDRYDGIIVQVAGEKVWHIGPNRHVKHTLSAWTAPRATDANDLVQYENGTGPDVCEDSLEEIVMKPGSVLFLPRGYWHGTKASGESFSLSIRLDPPLYADVVLAQLRQLLLADEEWRRPVYGAWGGEEARAAAQALLAERARALPAAVARLASAPSFRHVADVSDQLVHFPGAAPIWRPRNRPVTVERGPDAKLAVVRIGDTMAGKSTKLEISTELAAVVEWIAAASGSFSLDDLAARFPTAGAARLRGIVEELARRGALLLSPV